MGHRPPGIDWRRLDFDGFLALIPTEKAAFDFAFNMGPIDTERQCEVYI